MSALLEVRDLQVSYGQIEAVQGISFDVAGGEISTLVGANGAGKSTTLLALSGLVRAKGGSIRFDGEDVTRMKTHQIVERGLVQVAEGRAILTTSRCVSAVVLNSSCWGDQPAVPTTFSVDRNSLLLSSASKI